jgi:hypothetical protein
MMSAINEPMPRMEPIKRTTTAPVRSVGLVPPSTSEAVKIILSAEVQWMKSKGIIR